jgi:hypothetical protein
MTKTRMMTPTAPEVVMSEKVMASISGRLMMG